MFWERSPRCSHLPTQEGREHIEYLSARTHAQQAPVVSKKKGHNLIVFQTCMCPHVYFALYQLSSCSRCFSSYLCPVSLHPLLWSCSRQQPGCSSSPCVTRRRIWVTVYLLLPLPCILSLPPCSPSVLSLSILPFFHVSSLSAFV